ncbi:MAG: chromosome segregation protein SMC [Myxococcota bacterium]|nr:chromosome segregation protein SMC [Myxococcota bacterium]MDW8362701.1 chromosome segregation protein SMC [Myxococcales bacterium]
MKIRRLEMQGFKSFVDRAVLHFDRDVTGIVGPNGCGKSNIVDAIRWVLGEQSPRSLRGKEMQDVIFSGSEARGPAAFAEVSLTFDNTDGLGPPEYRDYAEVTVTRRLERDGTSGYFINGTEVRLMDVTNLFLGTGVGRRAYSIVEQGRIGFIVSSRPEDRRLLIEEAAGTTRFRKRRRDAERRLEQTRQNLLRVGDVLRELDASLITLRRQAQKAERYRQYRAEQRDLELWVASHRWLELTATHRIAAAAAERARGTVAGYRLGMRVREAELATERAALETQQAALDEAQRERFEADNVVLMLDERLQAHRKRQAELAADELRLRVDQERLEARTEALRGEAENLRRTVRELDTAAQSAAERLQRERAELLEAERAAEQAERDLAAWHDRMAGLQARLAHVEAMRAATERRVRETTERAERLRAERDAAKETATLEEQRGSGFAADRWALEQRRARLEERIEMLDRELSEHVERLATSERLVAALREEASEARNRLRSLEQVRDRFEGVGAGVRALLTACREGTGPAGLLGLVADRLEVEAEWTHAVAAALGERLEWIVVESARHAREAVAWMHAHDAGRATFVLRRPARVVRAVRVPEGTTALLDHVRVASEDRDLLAHLLDRIALVDDLDAAIALRERGIAGWTFVTPRGERVQPDGTVTGGRPDDAATHLLELHREIRELGARLLHLEARLELATGEQRTCESRVATARATLEGLRAELQHARIDLVRAEEQHESAREAAERARERVGQLDAELAELEATLSAAREEAGAASEQATQLGAQLERAQAERATLDEGLAARRAQLEALRASVATLEVEAATARERADGKRSALQRSERDLAEHDEAFRRLEQERTEVARRAGQVRGQRLHDAEARELAVLRARAAHERLAELQARFDEARAVLGRLEGEVRALRERLDEALRLENESVLREQQLSLDLQHLEQDVVARHRVRLGHVIGDHHLRERPDAAVHERIAELERLVERMGEVNLTAVEEYEEKSRRHAELHARKEDLERAVEQLERAIRDMNRESRRLFREAFEAIAQRFAHVFRVLFGGGRAELRLTGEDDVLEAGVDIWAQPPGKRLAHMDLLSGGEKALTAVSLIFAIFQYRPSPFCLLDEVDAPLDEANVGRFADAVRQMTDRSQFILVTHARRTMEAADVLYGVTMQTPGISQIVSVELRRRAAAEQPAVPRAEVA